MSVRYKLAPSVPGLAAISGENDKHLRYPASKGRSVTPCSLETWGRLGPSLTRFLDSLSASAQRRDVAHSLPRGLYLQRWLTMLSCTLNKCVSRAIFDSLHCSTPPPFNSVDPSSFLSAEHVSSTLAEADGPYGMRLFPFTGGFQRSPLTHPAYLPPNATHTTTNATSPLTMPPLTAATSPTAGSTDVCEPPLACQHPNTGLTETCSRSLPSLPHQATHSPEVRSDVAVCMPVPQHRVD